MAPRPTSSRDRNKGKAPKRPTSSATRANRSRTSTADTTQGRGGKPAKPTDKVTNASQRPSGGSGRGASRVTGGTQPSRPQLPPGRSGGALAVRPVGSRSTLNGKPVVWTGSGWKPVGGSGSSAARPQLPPASSSSSSSRRQAAEQRLRDAKAGSHGPNRVGQPAGEANRVYGANRVNQAVDRALRDNPRPGARGAALTGFLGALVQPLVNEVGRRGGEALGNALRPLGRSIDNALGTGNPNAGGRYNPGSRQVSFEQNPPPSRPSSSQPPAPVTTSRPAPQSAPSPSSSGSVGSSSQPSSSSQASSSRPSRSADNFPQPPAPPKVDPQSTQAKEPKGDQQAGTGDFYGPPTSLRQNRVGYTMDELKKKYPGRRIKQVPLAGREELLQANLERVKRERQGR